MKHPNRFHLWAAFECHAFSKAEAVLRFSAEEDGMWIQWQDYASLQAENERLTQEYSDATNHYNKLHNDSQAEVERLTIGLNDQGRAFLHLLAENERLRASSFVTAVPVEEYERLKAEVERLRKTWEWQPIETAPTGIQILLYSKDFCMIEGSVCDKTDPSDASEELLTLDHNGDDLYGMTHWMPLPNPPAAKDGKPSA